MIFFIDTKCKIRFIYVRFNCKRKTKVNHPIMLAVIYRKVERVKLDTFMKHKNEGKTIALKARELFLRPRFSNNSQPLYCNGTQKPPYSTPFRILCKTIYISAIRQGKS